MQAVEQLPKIWFFGISRNSSKALENVWKILFLDIFAFSSKYLGLKV